MLSEGEPTNVLISEGKLSSLQDVDAALKKLAENPTHTALFAKQQPLITDMQTKIYKVLDL